MHFLQPVGLERAAASHTVRPAGGRGAAPASGGQSPFAIRQGIHLPLAFSNCFGAAPKLPPSVHRVKDERCRLSSAAASWSARLSLRKKRTIFLDDDFPTSTI